MRQGEERSCSRKERGLVSTSKSLKVNGHGLPEAPQSRNVFTQLLSLTDVRQTKRKKF